MSVLCDKNKINSTVIFRNLSQGLFEHQLNYDRGLQISEKFFFQKIRQSDQIGGSYS